jgi:Bacterial Ig-like domain
MGQLNFKETKDSYRIFITLIVIISMLLIFSTCNSNVLINSIEERVESATGPRIPVFVLRQGGTVILNTGNYDYGFSEINKSEGVQFSIRNDGNASLQLTGAELVTITPTGGTGADIFTALQPSSPVAEGGTVNFTLLFNPGNTIAYSATVIIETNDPDFPMFEFDLTGTGTTDVNGPTVLSRTPVPDEPDHLISEEIRVEFDEEIDTSTFSGNFVVTDVTTVPSTVSGSITFESATNEAVFTPDSPFTAGNEYKIELSVAIKDPANNPLDQSYIWNFTAKASDNSTSNISAILSGMDVVGTDVSAYLLVLNQTGTALENMGKFNFKVEEKISTVWQQVDYDNVTIQNMGVSGKPKALSIIVDNSGSVGAGLIIQTMAISNFLSNAAYFAAGDEASIWKVFNQERVADFTDQVPTLTTALNSIPSGFISPVVECTIDALNYHISSSTSGMNAVLLGFDGINSGTYPDLAAQFSYDFNIPIYPFGFAPAANPAHVDSFSTAGYSSYIGNTISSMSLTDYENLFKGAIDHMNKAYVLTWPSFGGSGDSIDFRITVQYTAENGNWSPVDTDSFSLP